MVAHRHGFSITIDDTQQSERIEIARRFLQKNAFMRVADYSAIIGLSRSSTQRELRKLDNDQNSGFKGRGRGSHRVYVLVNEGEEHT